MVGVGMIGQIDYEHVEEVFVSLSDAGDRAGPAFASHKRRGRTRNSSSTDDRAYCRDRGRGSTECVTHPRYGENRPNAGNRITGRQDHRLGRLDALDYAGCGTCVVGSVEVDGVHLDLMALPHEVLLKV